MGRIGSKNDKPTDKSAAKGKKKDNGFKSPTNFNDANQKLAENPANASVHASIRQSITINEELNSHITPLQTEEYNALKLDIKENGVREPILLWQNPESEELLYIIVDGHHRYKAICELSDEMGDATPQFILNFPFDKDQIKHIKSINELKIYMSRRQLSRRNLSKQGYYYHIGYIYNSIITEGKKSDTNEAENLAAEFGITKRTIMRYHKLYRGINKLPIDLRLDYFSVNSFGIQMQSIMELADLSDIEAKDIIKQLFSGNQKDKDSDDKKLNTQRKSSSNSGWLDLFNTYAKTDNSKSEKIIKSGGAEAISKLKTYYQERLKALEDLKDSE
ncbi:ParB N-terminal domain-containing protein [Saccharicrinis aurantiacus]|uniref:ParB N-terminal domain-containing protein n=1 Tax=Saccharicrinis aurantiacus TaxID=1849719 RepID=UPI0009501656|nr:ParB N-terminal domain-containing protein [Saccharicrinis aurantiacus]